MSCPWMSRGALISSNSACLCKCCFLENHQTQVTCAAIKDLGSCPSFPNTHPTLQLPGSNFFKKKKRTKKNTCLEVPLLGSGLNFQHCHCSDSGHCCGAGSIRGPGTSTCLGHGQNQNQTTYLPSCTPWLILPGPCTLSASPLMAQLPEVF